MKDQLVYIMKYSIIGSNALSIFLCFIWIIFMFREISFGKFNSPSIANIVFDFAKSIAYFVLAYISYKMYISNNNINVYIDIIGGSVYILAMLEGTHNFLNSVVIFILEKFVKLIKK